LLPLLEAPLLAPPLLELPPFLLPPLVLAEVRLSSFDANGCAGGVLHPIDVARATTAERRVVVFFIRALLVGCRPAAWRVQRSDHDPTM
jgi:hypothetical protein